MTDFFRCSNCGHVGRIEDLLSKDTWLDDDAWGAGPSRITVCVCPGCGSTDDLEMVEKHELSQEERNTLDLEDEDETSDDQGS